MAGEQALLDKLVTPQVMPRRLIGKSTDLGRKQMGSGAPTVCQALCSVL